MCLREPDGRRALANELVMQSLVYNDVRARFKLISQLAVHLLVSKEYWPSEGENPLRIAALSASA